MWIYDDDELRKLSLLRDQTIEIKRNNNEKDNTHIECLCNA